MNNLFHRGGRRDVGLCFFFLGYAKGVAAADKCTKEKKRLALLLQERREGKT